ncbi:hypothetical protein D3C87_1552600 [compost metagenome]
MVIIKRQIRCSRCDFSHTVYQILYPRRLKIKRSNRRNRISTNLLCMSSKFARLGNRGMPHMDQYFYPFICSFHISISNGHSFFYGHIWTFAVCTTDKHARQAIGNHFLYQFRYNRCIYCPICMISSKNCCNQSLNFIHFVFLSSIILIILTA